MSASTSINVSGDIKARRMYSAEHREPFSYFRVEPRVYSPDSEDLVCHPVGLKSTWGQDKWRESRDWVKGHAEGHETTRMTGNSGWSRSACSYADPEPDEGPGCALIRGEVGQVLVDQVRESRRSWFREWLGGGSPDDSYRVSLVTETPLLNRPVSNPEE